MKKKIKAALILTLLSSHGFADCVINAKSKTSFVLLDTHTIYLQGGIGQNIIIKTYAFLRSNSNVTILKDNFCSFESAALYIDGEVVNANEVTNVRQ